MTRKEMEERTAFENILTSECSIHADAVNAARLLCRHGKTYSRIQEAVCNGPAISDHLQAHGDPKTLQGYYDRHEKWCERRENQLEKRIRAIVQTLGPGFGVVFSGDPRGATVKIIVPSGRTNDWGHEGICVPTA